MCQRGNVFFKFRKIFFRDRIDGHQKNVHPCIDCQLCRIIFIEMLCNSVHFHCVRCDNTLKPHITTQNICNNRFGKRCGDIYFFPCLFGDIGIGFNLRIDNVGGHYHLTACIDTSLKRNKFVLFQFIITLVDTRQTCMTVGIGITVTGKMFERRDDSDIIQCFNIGCPLLCNCLSIIRERTHTDYRIGRIIIDVNIGGKVGIDTECRQFIADNRSGFFCCIEVICSTESHISRCNGSLSQTCNTSALLVYGNEKLRTFTAFCIRLLKRIYKTYCIFIGRCILTKQNYSRIAVILKCRFNFRRNFRHICHIAVLIYAVTECRHYHLTDFIFRCH